MHMETLPKHFKITLLWTSLFVLTGLYGCGGDDPKPVECVPGFKSGLSLKVNDVTRSYNILLPTGYCNSTDFPVIIDLHGASSNKEDQRSFSGFDEIANTSNIIMVWPQALVLSTCLSNTNRWNANFTGTPYDVNFISALIDRLIADYKVDEKRIYVTGMSNGGFMTYSLAPAAKAFPIWEASVSVVTIITGSFR